MQRTLFDTEHEMFRSSLRQFIKSEIEPSFERWEADGIVDRTLYEAAGDAGLMGLLVPAEHGGGGAEDPRFEAVLQEEMGRSGMMSAGQGIVNHQVAVAYFVALATDKQRARWLPGIASGDLLCTVAMTEPATGSDIAAISTRAMPTEDAYIVNGAKIFISSGILSDLVVVVCRTGDADAAHRNLSLVVLERGMDGFTRGRNLSKIGQHAADTGELFFDDVIVPKSNLLGEEGRGFYHLMENLPSERLGIAVLAVAHAEAAFEWTLDYARERRAFKTPIASFQHNRFAFATMRTELDVARVFVDRQIQALCAGELTAEDAAEAKWWCTDLNRRVVDQCLQLHGGYGYMEEYPIARAWRDGRAMSIYGGTNEIMKDLIGRRSLGI